MSQFNRIDTTKTKEIRSIKIRRRVDQSPDTSWIGKYTDDLKPGVIVRKHGEFYEKLGEDAEIPERGREYRCFLPYAGGEKVGTADYYSNGLQDFERMESLERGEWYFLGVDAVAQIVVHGVIQTIESGGLWGIESDSDEDYIESVEKEEIDALRRVLAELGFSKTDIDDAVANCTKCED